MLYGGHRRADIPESEYKFYRLIMTRLEYAMDEHKDNADIMRVRLKEYSVDDCKAVIDKKVLEWKGDDKMEKFLRPSTLFNPSKFENYLNQPTPNGKGSQTKQGGNRGNYEQGVTVDYDKEAFGLVYPKIKAERAEA